MHPIPQKSSLRFFDLIKLSLRIFKTKPLRTALTILGMSVGISTVVFLVSLGYGLQYILLGKLITTEDSLITLSASYRAESDLGINQKTINDIRALPDVAETSPIAEFSGELSVGDLTGLMPIIRVVEPNMFRLSGTNPDLGVPFLQGEEGIVLSAQALQTIGVIAENNALGKISHIKIYFPKLDGTFEELNIDKALPILGINTDDQQPPMAIIPSTIMPVPPTSFKEILVKAKNIDSVEPLRDTLEKQGFIISARIDLVNQAKKLTNIITITLAIFGITALIVSAIGMFNTMLIGFIERTYEVGVLKSIGATDTEVRNLFLMESIVIGTLGGIGGILIGLGLGKILNFGLSIMATRMGGVSFDLFILPNWFAFAVLGLSIVIGTISGLLPALRAARLSPREAFMKK
ncbi:MAG: FtsX-like permease family protein [Patescibacteria group bacterium]